MKTIKFFVHGEPQPFPKKRTNRKTGMIYSHDPKGVKRAWMDCVSGVAWDHLENSGDTHALYYGLDADTPVRLILEFYRTKPKSNKDQYPHKKPDLDNLAYAVANAVNGVCYHDDSRIIEQRQIKLWADDEHPPGVQVIIKVVT